MKRSMRLKEPRQEEFLSDEDYEKAVKAYEDAVYWAEEEAMEKYYEKQSNA